MANQYQGAGVTEVVVSQLQRVCLLSSGNGFVSRDLLAVYQASNEERERVAVCVDVARRSTLREAREVVDQLEGVEQAA